VGRLFLGGFVPGILMGVGLMVLIYFFSFHEAMPKDPLYGLGEIWGSIPVGLPVAAHAHHSHRRNPERDLHPDGGLGGGRRLRLRPLLLRLQDRHPAGHPGIIVDTFVTTAVVTFIISATSGFSYLLIVGRIGTLLVESTLALTRNPWIILFIINIALLIWMLDGGGVLLILLTPILVPMMKSLGVDLVHFGLVMVLT